MTVPARRVEPFRPWFLDYFDKAQPRGIEKWRALCPRCGGDDRRFSISAGESRWVANCHGASRDEAHLREALGIVGLCYDDLRYDAERGGGYTSTVREPQTSPLNPLATSGGDGVAEVEEQLKAYSAGTMRPEPVILPALPAGSSEAVRAVAAFFELVYGLRLNGCDERPVPFGRDWVGTRTGLPGRTVGRVLARLVESGVLEQGPSLPARPPKQGTHTYLPGPGGPGGPGRLRVIRGGAA